MKITTLTFDTIDSTNTEALKHARAGAGEGLCIVARQQTAGRGRHGRVWFSERDAGLYYSIILRPRLETQQLPLITLMTGVSVHDTLKGLGLGPDIKWVNDILVNEKKICGILAETAETPSGIAVVVGIGINLTSLNFPPEIAATATSIEEITGQRIPPAELAAALTDSLRVHYSSLSAPGGDARIIDEWRKRSSYFSGKSVRVKAGGELIEGITDGLEPNGALRVKRDDGTLEVIRSGDVERVRSNT
jgi:BirA family transcriptional regulator, biotin operon repressor / biotin---[acetyl-CoA-carboxylase] ligase